MTASIIGWDIGGAHVKAAIIHSPNAVAAVYQQPCPLWQGLDKLRQAVEFIQNKISCAINVHALTMTGELADLFSGRDDGVHHILAAMNQRLGNAEILVYAGKLGFLKLNEINQHHYAAIASANWLASVTLAAQRMAEGLFVDIGSTTTDILPFAQGKVMAEGYTDYQRLISQELIYTGVVRTPVMAVAQTMQDGGKEVGMMAEYFATMADVYRLTGELDEAHDQAETADGGEKTASASARRLARMLGCDYNEGEYLRWRQVAANLRQQQLSRLQQACVKQRQRSHLPADAPVIGAGIGRFLLKDIAQNMGAAYIDYADLFTGLNSQSDYDVADCAPAAAVACLAAIQ